MKRTTIAATFLLAGALGAQENYSQWAQHRNLYINTAGNGAQVATNVTGFPLLVRLDSANFATGFAQARGQGQDLRFTKAGDAARLPHQIERWDSAGRKAEVWVLVDTVYGNSRTQFIRMHWGKNDAADSSRGTAVFDTAKGFQAVWHLNEAANDSARDATGNRFHAAPTASPGSTTGAVGLARTFDGMSQHFEVPGSASGKLNFPQDGIYTISAWAYLDAASDVVDRVIAAKHDNQYALKISTDQRWQFFEYDGTWDIAGSPYESGRWTHLTGVLDGRDTHLYVDGVLAESSLDCCGGGGSRDETVNFFIGRAGESARRWWWGHIDELRVASVARSATWARLSYHTQKPGATVVSDTIQTVSAPGAPTNVTAARLASNKTSIVVSWGAAPNGGEAISQYKAYVTTDTARACTTNGALTCTITGLSLESSYTIAVKAANSAGTGPAANSGVVTSLAPHALYAATFDLRHEAGHLRFNLPAEAVSAGAQVSVTLLDPNGRMLWQRLVAAQPGANRVAWKSEERLPPGLYFARVVVSDARGARVASLDAKVPVLPGL